MSELTVHGAREHNLADITVSMPHGSLIAICGRSGSGKSTLAFDTIYAEAQRRYLESVSPFTRHLLGSVASPEVDSISGLPAAVAVRQLVSNPAEHSSVGTLSQVADLLRVLYSRMGTYPKGQEHLLASAFSANTVEGACSNCAAKGTVHDIDRKASVPDPDLSIWEGAVDAWPGGWVGLSYRRICAVLGIDIDAPWRTLPQETRDWVLTTEETPTVTVHPESGSRPYEGKFRSARRYLLDTVTGAGSAMTKEKVLRYLTDDPCPVCDGTGLARASLSVTIGGENIAQVAERSLTDMVEFLQAHVSTSGEANTKASELLLSELEKRVRVIADLGVGYLSADRPAAGLSAGELQRLRLAAHLHSGLFGMLYVFDELSTGLHPADIRHLFTFIEKLRDAGNTVILVEHDMETVRRCDWVVELGPGGGPEGGQLMYSGPLPDAPLTNSTPPIPWREPEDFSEWAQVDGLSTNNLKGCPVTFPVGAVSVVTGPSGSGKSSLLRSVASLSGMQLSEDSHEVSAAERRGLEGATAKGLDAFARVVSFDQRAIGRSPRSVIGTYVGVFDKIRSMFAKASEFGASQFSFNTAKGRCSRCEGLGMITVDLVHLPASSGRCPECEGKRFSPETLAVTVDGLTIADVLELSVNEAAERFPDYADYFEVLRTVGLGGLLLGQSTSTLSGGESQRLRLAAALRTRGKQTLYILDEPLNGLHPDDARVLSRMFRDMGDTVLMADHNMESAAGADWLIDMGPAAGPDGGQVVAMGTPREVAEAGHGVTAQILAGLPFA
ncbi:ATP-binding cassette domain-containing protein [Corynebacterium sputi]|uniref:ATP-binding cassette domain-containing protein n=1 Tax=Corynebacterium sputi TaxID=489915 RepID=UPI0004131144|nr:ATP-binding cassette domain-containing protein [Corynebacterium sputi]